MKALVVTDKHKMELQDIPKPEIKPGKSSDKSRLLRDLRVRSSSLF